MKNTPSEATETIIKLNVSFFVDKYLSIYFKTAKIVKKFIKFVKFVK